MGLYKLELSPIEFPQIFIVLFNVGLYYRAKSRGIYPIIIDIRISINYITLFKNVIRQRLNTYESDFCIRLLLTLRAF